MFKKMSWILLAIIAVFGTMSSSLPSFYQSVGYGIGLSVQSFIAFVLPIVVFALLFKTVVHFSAQASKMIVILLGAVCCSSFIATMLSYGIGSYVYTLDIAMNFPDESRTLVPVGNILFPKWIANNHAMFLGVCLGLILGKASPSFARSIAVRCEQIVSILLRFILVVIPFLVAGSIIKMNYDGVMGDIIRNYWVIFVVIASSAFSYIALLYCYVNRFDGRAMISSIKNILPAAVTGFGTMSSAAAMPLTILGTEKNSKNKELAASIIPATVNIHMLGDCFAIPILAFAVLKGFGLEVPSFSEYLIFVGFFILTKFSAAGVPGGSMLVMMPVLEKHLGFDSQMLSFATALYILLDPVITSANIYGNGAFAMVMDRFFYKRASLQQAHSS